MAKKATKKIITEPIDGRRLDACIKDLRLSKIEVCAGIGKGKTYINQCIIDGRIAKTAIIALDAIYGIKYDDYKPIEESKTGTAVTSSIDANEISKIVKSVIEEKFTEDFIAEAIKTAMSSYAWKEIIAQNVRFVLREEPTEDMIKRIIHEAIDEKLG